MIEPMTEPVDDCEHMCRQIRRLLHVCVRPNACMYVCIFVFVWLTFYVFVFVHTNALPRISSQTYVQIHMHAYRWKNTWACMYHERWGQVIQQHLVHTCTCTHLHDHVHELQVWWLKADSGQAAKYDISCECMLGCVAFLSACKHVSIYAGMYK